ncbi:hypothetical protein [Massilia aerilata]|uniref:Uncharacterized protein n=1 Tax=Massilia aerilata TaxID=453817 RepID=A0ABW0RXD5_9BURK
MSLTTDQQAGLRQAARATQAGMDALARKDCAALAALLSVGRTHPSATEVGNGTILATIGIDAGNSLLDHIGSDPSMRHVKPLLEQGRLKVGSPVAQGAIRAFATANVITQSQADALCALGVEPDPLTAQDVADALFNPDGTEK